MRGNSAGARSGRWLFVVLALCIVTCYLYASFPLLSSQFSLLNKRTKQTTTTVVQKTYQQPKNYVNVAKKEPKVQQRAAFYTVPVEKSSIDSDNHENKRVQVVTDKNAQEKVSKLKNMADSWKARGRSKSSENNRILPVWPEPKTAVQKDGHSFSKILDSFSFHLMSDDLTAADIEHFTSNMDRTIQTEEINRLKCISPETVQERLESLYVDLEQNQDAKSEQYELIVGAKYAYLSAKSKTGVLRGMNTFMQLVLGTLQSEDWCQHLRIPAELYILDEPAYGHRGLLLDTARNYYSVDFVKKVIRTLAMLKMNVLHWHLSDDESFGIQSTLFPGLTDIRDPDLKFRFYTQAEIKEIVAEANKWGVLIIPEIDIPGHTGSWFNLPNVLAKCPMRACTKAWGLELNPYNKETWDVIKGLLLELTELFPGSPMHLGGDEVTSGCWSEDPMMSANPASKEEKWMYFEQELRKVLETLPGSPSVIRWQESAPYKPNNTNYDVSFQIWMHPNPNWIEKWAIPEIPIISSLGWYLDNQCMRWQECYEANPLQPIINAKEKANSPLKMLGFEACAWELPEDAYGTENIWARLIAIGDRMWTGRFGKRSEVEAEQGLMRMCRILAKEWDLFPEFLCTTDHLNKRASTPHNILEFPKRKKKRDTQICARMNKYSKTAVQCVAQGCSYRNV